MSISSMTNAAFARRTDQNPPNEPQSFQKIAASVGENPETQTATSSALGTIANFIPTEVLTLYVAVIAALRSGTETSSGNTQTGVPGSLWAAFILFFVFTPVVTWLSYAGRVRKAKGTIPKSPKKWPRWEMFAATVAFLAWALALPQTPFTAFSWYSAAIAGIVVLIVTTGLGLLAPVIQQPLEV